MRASLFTLYPIKLINTDLTSGKVSEYHVDGKKIDISVKCNAISNGKAWAAEKMALS